MSRGKVIIHLQPPTWGLPTCQPDFLQVLTYCKLANINFEVAQEAHFGGSAMVDGKGYVPVMHAEMNGNISVVAGVNEIVQRLKDHGMNLDAHLSARERAEVFAFISMLQSPLQTAMECEWYLNEANWQNVVKPLYATGSFPANWLLPKQVHDRMRRRLGCYDPDRLTHTYQSAAACYAALSERLGDSTYFCGERPCSLDVAVFSHLAVHLYAPMEEAKLSSLLQAHTNLVNFVEKFRGKHVAFTRLEPPPPLPDKLLSEHLDTAAAKTESKGTLSPADKDRHRKAKDFLALAALLTLGYCLFNNVIDVDGFVGDGGVDA